MQEQTISRYTAAKIIEKYYKYHYYDLVNVKVKPKIEQNDLYMYVKLQSIINRKKIVEKFILNEGQIKETIMDYFEVYYCSVKEINYEPYFHNINIKYEGSIELEPKKHFVKMKRVV